MLVLFAAAAVADPTLSISGSCPGPMTIEVADLPPFGTHALVASDSIGPSVIGAGVCAGAPIGLQPPYFLVASPTADGAGVRTYIPFIDAPFCDHHVQVVDLADCSLSSIEPFTPDVVDPGDLYTVVLDAPVDHQGAQAVVRDDGSVDVAVGQGGTTWVFKLAPDGTVLRSFEISDLFAVDDAVLMPEGDLVLFGSEFADDPSMVRIDQDTDAVVFSRVMEHPQRFHSGTYTEDGVLIGGSIYTAGIDPDTGDVLWYRNQTERGRVWAAAPAPGSGFYAAPQDDYDGFDHNFVTVQRVDSDGTVLWGRLVEGAEASIPRGAVQASNGDVVVAGTTGSGVVCMLSRFAPDGTHLWTKDVGHDEGFACLSAAPTPDNGVVLVGEVDNEVDRDRGIAKVDSDGEVVWARRYTGGPASDVQAVPGGGYVVIGDLLDISVFKVDAEGRNGCEEDVDLVSVDSDVDIVDWLFDEDTDQGTHLGGSASTPIDADGVFTCPVD